MRQDCGHAASRPRAPRSVAPPQPAPPRRAARGLGGWLRDLTDRVIAASSLVSTAPVLDMRDFAWTATLRDGWRAIRDEAIAVALSPDVEAGDAGQGFALWRRGRALPDRLARCPATAAIVAAVPGLSGAGFTILAPGAQLPARRGPTKGLVTCHLGLIVPRDGDVRMRIDDRIVRWAEGETLVFDDSCDHAVWNETGGTCVLLAVTFERPLRRPGRWLAALLCRRG